MGEMSPSELDEETQLLRRRALDQFLDDNAAHGPNNDPRVASAQPFEEMLDELSKVLTDRREFLYAWCCFWYDGTTTYDRVASPPAG